METKHSYKPGDRMDYSPELWGEALTYAQLRQMQGRLVLVDDEWYTDYPDRSARGVEVMLVLNTGTDTDGDEYIRLADHDGKAFPTHIYPNDMDPPDDADESYTRVWRLITPPEPCAEEPEEQQHLMQHDILSIESDCFIELRQEFNSMLQKTIFSMIRRESDDAALTLKLHLRLDHTQDSLHRAVIRPDISHKITSAITVKDDLSGRVSGDYELMYDARAERYLLRELPTDDGQMTLL